MREIRLSGSEGGGPARKAGLPTPIVLGCVWVWVWVSDSRVEARSAAGGLDRRPSASRASDLGSRLVEPCGGFDRSAAPTVTANGANEIRSSLSLRAVAPEGDGARSADRLGRRPELAIPRDFSRTTCLRGVGWYQVCVAGQQACSRKWPRQAPRCSGGEPLGRGVQRSSNRSRVAANAR